MKLQIIETPDYILAVSDEEIKEFDAYVTKYGGICESHNGSRIILFKTDKKITAYQPKGNAPKLDLPLLPEIVVEEDVEKLAEEYVIDESYLPVYKEECKRAYINGHKSATKVYSEDDLRKAIKKALYYWTKNANTELQAVNDIIKSLKQPKTPLCFVPEMETSRIPYGYDGWKTIEDEGLKTIEDDGWKTIETGLKTTTINGKTYLVGTYLYE
jgi:hypothetical protein